MLVEFTSAYLNLEGREGRGIVSAAEADTLKRQIAEQLQSFTDPQTGKTIVRRAYVASDVYLGPQTGNGPDIVLGMNVGYRVSWQTALGGAPAALLEPNRDAWTVDHLFDPSMVPGIFLSNLKPNRGEVAAQDVAATVLACSGVEPAVPTRGRSVL